MPVIIEGLKLITSALIIKYCNPLSGIADCRKTLRLLTITVLITIMNIRTVSHRLICISEGIGK